MIAQRESPSFSRPIKTRTLFHSTNDAVRVLIGLLNILKQAKNASHQPLLRSMLLPWLPYGWCEAFLAESPIRNKRGQSVGPGGVSATIAVPARQAVEGGRPISETGDGGVR